MRNRNIRNKLTSVYLMLGMILLVIGFSYAFFIYNKTGLYTHTITGGKMKVIYDELAGNNILIENAYPRTDEEALEYGLEFEFTVTGYNESEKNIYYAIEMDYGDDLNGKNRFLDTDMKLSLYENDELLFENEIFNNLDNQDIHYNYFKAGTNSENPTINHYKMRIWINDNVIISDTLSEDLGTWGEYEFQWFLSKFNITSNDEFFNLFENACPGIFENGPEGCNVSNFGMNIYTTEEFQNSYANFKVNIKADLTYKDAGTLMYDANGGTFDVESTSLLTNMITTRKPVMEGKGFLGWSSNSNATVPEYYAGDYYTGGGQMLYAVYSDTRNVMGTFPESIIEYAGKVQQPMPESNELYDYSINNLNVAEPEYSEDVITQIYFINDLQSKIDTRYEVAEIKADITYNNQGKVLAWLELDEENGGNILYVGAYGTIYFSDCVNLFSPFIKCIYIDLANVDSSDITNMDSMFYINDSYYVGGVSNNINDYEVKKLLKI